MHHGPVLHSDVEHTFLQFFWDELREPVLELLLV